MDPSIESHYEDNNSGQEENEMDKLNDALEELGMLSAITKARMEYMQEMSRRHFPRPTDRDTMYANSKINNGNNSNAFRGTRGAYGTSSVTDCNINISDSNSRDQHPISGGFYVLQKNTEYVTELLGMRDSAAAIINGGDGGVERGDVENQNSSSYKYSKASLENQSLVSRVSKYKHGRKLNHVRFQKPYEFPWRMHLEERVRTVSWNNQDSDSSSRDSGIGINRSNPGSPEKVQVAPGGSGASGGAGSCGAVGGPPGAGGSLMLPRSRSLDDLVASVVYPPPGCGEMGQKQQEIDYAMSQRMEDLHVTYN